MQRWLVLYLLSICIVPFSALGEDETFRVGVILPLTGETASLGKGIQNSLELAHRDLDPELRQRVELLFEDDALVPKNTVSAFKKLINIDEVDAVISVASSTSKAIAPLADRQQVPLIALASDPEVALGRTHVVNFWVTPEEEARRFVEELRKRNIRRIARIDATHDGTLSFRKAVRDIMPQEIETVLTAEFDAKAMDFKSFLTRLRREKVDAIWVNLFFGQTGLFARQAQELQVDVPLVGIETFESPDDVKASQGALIGQWYVQADAPSESFLQRFREEYPDSALFAVGNAYDSLQLIGLNVERGGSAADLNKLLRSIENFQGVSGTFSATGDNRFTLPATVMLVTADGFVEATDATR